MTHLKVWSLEGKKLIQHLAITCCNQLSELNEELNYAWLLFLHSSKWVALLQ